MEGVFAGVTTDAIESWFSNLIVYDINFPHTSNRISPITFTEFLGRSSIICTNQEQVYDCANKFWRRYVSFTPDILNKIRGKYNLDICEEEHAGWNKLVDYFNRILDVQKFDNNHYYQMHYLSHVCHLFYTENFSCVDERSCNRTIFNEVISPILYAPNIPVAKYFWLPVMNYADMRFGERLVDVCLRASAFIENHSGRSMDPEKYDIKHLNNLYNIVKQGLDGIHANKYNDNLWKVPLIECLTQATIIKADVDACELHDSFEQNGMKCCGVIKKLQKAKDRFEKDILDDPDIAIDQLLDCYSLLKKNLASYNIPAPTKKAKS